MHKKISSKYYTLFCLYIAQSIPMSFFSTVLPVIMRQENYSLQSIGMLQLIKLPWIFKFLWAPLVDNHARGTAELKRWIILSELFYAAVIVGIGLLKVETDFMLIIGLMIVAFIASGTQDIATDTYAMMILDSKSRCMGNSMQSAGSFLGTLMGTGVLLITYYYLGWSMLMMALALLVLLALIPLSRTKGQEIQKTSKKRVRLADIPGFFKQKGALNHILILVTYYSAIIVVLSLLKSFMVDHGYSVKEIGLLSGVVGAFSGMAASFAAGFVVRKYGTVRSLSLFLVLIGVAILYFTALSFYEPNAASIVVGVVLLWGSYGFASVAIYTFAMNFVRKGLEGTDFTLQIVLTHLSSMVIAIVSGRVGDLGGYTLAFSLGLVFVLVAALALRFYALRVKQYQPEMITLDEAQV